MNVSELTPKELAEHLGTKYSLIKYYYYEKGTLSHYRDFEIPKKSGGLRKIRSPSDQLSNLQRKIYDMLSRLYRPRTVVKAFRVGSSIRENAKQHTRKTFVLNFDIENFYDSITFYRIKGLLQSKPYEFTHETASVISHLVTCEGRLPQGAPSSPIISNMICSRMDGELLRLAKDCRATYTRYADDITFSFLGPAECISDHIVKLDRGCWHYSYKSAELGDKVRAIVENNGFKINEKKTRLQSKSQKQVVTGLVVNKKVNVDRKYIRKTSAIIHAIEVNGIENARERYEKEGGNPDIDLYSHLRGRLLFIYQIKGGRDKVYRRLAIRFNALPCPQKAPLPRSAFPERTLSSSMISRCWVLEESEIECTQGTGVVIGNDLILTCAHFFTKGESFSQFEAFRVDDRHRYKAELVFKCEQRDLAIARFTGDTPHIDNFFDVELMEECIQHEQVTLWGFPNHKVGAEGISCTYARVTQKGVASGVHYAEVDKPIHGGNSGGPALNSEGHLIGIVHHGADKPDHHNAFLPKLTVLSFWNDFCKEHKDLVDL